MKKILVPFDGSDNALRAIHYAATVAIETPGVELVLLHVLDPMVFTSPAALLSPDELSRLYPVEAAHIIDPARQILDIAGIAYTLRVRVGAAAGAIASEAYESQCDGIIMGTRGMGAIANVLIGSVASHVVHLVHIPVTLIK